MATKDQERKALEQIKKLLASLGDDSYIVKAMDGMIADAEENIENDFYMSWKDRAEKAQKEFEKANDRIIELSKMYNKEKDDAERSHEMSEFLAKRADELNAQRNNAQEINIENEKKIEALEDEIIRLKAKLYDCMTK